MLVDDLAYSRWERPSGGDGRIVAAGEEGGGRVGVRLRPRRERAPCDIRSLFRPLAERVEVLYLPDRPGKVRGSAWERFGFDALMCLAGLSCLVRGVLTRRSV